MDEKLLLMLQVGNLFDHSLGSIQNDILGLQFYFRTGIMKFECFEKSARSDSLFSYGFKCASVKVAASINQAAANKKAKTAKTIRHHLSPRCVAGTDRIAGTANPR